MPFQRIDAEKLSRTVVRQIEQLILRGILRPGERLPSERELSERLGVSRPSLREAVAELQDRGLLATRAGAGIYVADVLGSAFSPALIRLFAAHEEAVCDYLAFRRDLEGVAAARAAHAHEFILRLPQGYDSLAGERGQALSGGERQRISIARALLIDPRILILDEATSSVDSTTEKEIQKALDNLVQGRTTLAIAHRLSTLRRADRLVVLDRGQVAEVGNHDELMAREGAYFRLYQAQARNVDTDMDEKEWDVENEGKPHEKGD